MQKILLKKQLNKFINNLLKKYEVIAPVKTGKGHSKFQGVSHAGQMHLREIADVPVKEFFMPESEVLVEFKGEKARELKKQNKKRVIFGLRKCDLNGLRVLDKVMCDPAYCEKRRNTLVIGMFCEHPDEFCFCESMELEDPETKGVCDLFFWPKGDKYYVSVCSDRGKELVKGLSDAKKELRLRYKNKKKLVNKEIESQYQNKIWETDSEKCLSCGACTAWCPTCNCFDLSDNLDINLKDSQRIRKQASCMLRSFSQVAGGKVFRESRISRFKHFVYHKIPYFKKSCGRYMCVGCGRCLRACPTHIDWVKTINLLGGKK